MLVHRYASRQRNSLSIKRIQSLFSRQLQTIDNDIKTNPAQVQLLSPKLQAQLFKPYEKTATVSTSENSQSKELLAQEHLQLQGIWGKKNEIHSPINLELPKLIGPDIEQHFMRIGLEQAYPQLEQCETLAKITLPTQPTAWKKVSGWTRYGADGSTSSVPHPLESIMVFDVEVLVCDGKYPTIAVVATPDAWYSWTSPYLTGDSPDKEQLISFGNHQSKRLVVGHNVSYDRARISEEYSRVASNIKYVDTMSLHIAVAGLCSQQRPAWNMEVKRRSQDRLEGITEEKIGDQSTKFFDVSTLNSLKDVAKFYCKVEMDKSQRSYFVTGSLQDIQDNFQDLMSYCANDVQLTHDIYKVVFPRFRKNCPHPVSFAGMLNMGNSFLTVTEKWEDYLEKSSSKHKELDDMLDIKLRDLAERARDLVNEPAVWQSDPWLSQLDWLVNPRQRKLKGSPKWYKDAYDTKAEKLKISTRSRVAPLLLRLKWQDYPLHFITENGWCFKVPVTEATETQRAKSIHNDETYYYLKVPHKDGEDANCGNPLAKNYIESFEDKVLTSEYEAAREALELNAKSAYWISSRERILGQFVVWNSNKSVDMQLPKKETGKYGIILPQMVTMGTVTRRAVERTWLTASNAKKNRIGSELKSMVQAPEGYKIVGADVDSEELWISSTIGDAQFGFHGATALGWMTLQGTKSEGTDLHSKTAGILGISRDKAKTFNYARIYGAGVKYATSLLMQYNQSMELEAAKQRALDLYSSTKGEKEHSAKNPFKRSFWHGGSESYMFNALETIALSKEPRTPVLSCCITDALKPRYTGTQFLTSRINWVVQSSGVDYLHLLIVSMSHLIEKYQIDARFMLSVHDEVRYMTSDKDKHRTAFALQIANVWTRALFSYKLGIYNLPQSVAFFSSVDIDHVLRKEPNMTCLTPSHEEIIPEGVGCTLLDTVNALTQDAAAAEKNQESTECLLGPSIETSASQFKQETILELLEKVKSISNDCDLTFLKAQMHKKYSNRDPSFRGNRETEMIIKRR